MDLITSFTKLVTTLNVFIPGTSSSVILMTVPNPYVSDAECGGLRGERSSCPAEPVCGLTRARRRRRRVGVRIKLGCHLTQEAMGLCEGAAYVLGLCNRSGSE